MASGSGDQTQNTGVFPAMQEYACSTGNNGVVYPQYGIGYSSGQNGAQGAYLQHQHFEGCMYMSRNGQMCGPYPPEQLYEGLSTGFLPRSLAIYAVFGGKTADPVQLIFLKQFLSQWNVDAMASTPNASTETEKVASHAKMVFPDVWLALLSIFVRVILSLPAFLTALVPASSLLVSFKRRIMLDV